MAADDKVPGLRVDSIEDCERYLEQVRSHAAATTTWIIQQKCDPLSLLRRMKFEEIGFHPVEGRSLNVIEQLNQTWTYVAALASAKFLLQRHPEAGGFNLAPGAHMSMPLDIMSIRKGFVGAETFAAVDPKNNAKLAGDLKKMVGRDETHRYVFFMSPLYTGIKRLEKFEKDGVQVWSVDI